MKISDAVKIYSTLNEIEMSRQCMPILTCYKMLKNRESLSVLLGPFFQTKDQLIMELSKGKGKIKREDPAFSEYTEQISKIIQEEIEFNPEKVKVSDFGNLSLSIGQMESLKPIIEEEEEEK